MQINFGKNRLHPDEMELVAENAVDKFVLESIVKSGYAVSMAGGVRGTASVCVSLTVKNEHPLVADFRQQFATYESRRAELKESLYGQHVAIQAGRIIDKSHDPKVLLERLRVQPKSPGRCVLIREVKDQSGEAFTVMF